MLGKKLSGCDLPMRGLIYLESIFNLSFGHGEVHIAFSTVVCVSIRCTLIEEHTNGHADLSQFFCFCTFSFCTVAQIAPTDSRLRPDIRLLEEGKADESAAEKHRLEEKQRAARKLRERQKDQWIPR